LTDYNQTDWKESDNDNIGVAPNGLQGGESPSKIPPAIRAIRGAARRNYVRQNPVYTTTSSGNVYLLTYEVAATAYVKGDVYRFYVNANNSGPATLNVSSLGARAIVSQSGAALTANQLAVFRVIEVVYDGTNFALINNTSHDALFTGNTVFANLAGNGSGLTALNGSNIATGTIADARLPTTFSAKTMTGSFAVQTGAAGVNGSVGLVSGDTTNTGYMEFRQKDGTRAGFIGYAHTTIAKRLGLSTENGYSFDFAGSIDPTVNGNKIWHAGNDGVGSGLDAGLLAGLPADSTAGSNSIVVRDGNADIVVRDAVIARNTTSGYIFLTTNKSISFGFDGTYIRTQGADFKVNGVLEATGNVKAAGEITSTSGNFVTQSVSAAGNAHYWYRSNLGVNRAITYFAPGNDTWNVQLYNSAGANVRALSYAQSTGLFYVTGSLGTNGQVEIGSAIVFNDGNIKFAGNMTTSYGAYLSDALAARIKNDGGTYSINVTGNAGTASAAAISATLRQSGTGAGMTFNWSGQAGQPSWMWGGDSPANMYVYNPSNFSVSQANNATNLAGLDSNQWARIAYSTNNLETAYPMGTYLPAYSPGGVPRNHDRNLRLDTSNTGLFRADGVGTLLAGTYRCKGYLTNDLQLYQRVG
jgi:hypothetical protein